METIEILRKARELIKDEDNWIQEVFGRNSEGMSLSMHDSGHSEAYRWCAWGATLCIRQRAGGYQGSPIDDSYNELLVEVQTLGFSDVPAFNDSSTHEEVLALFDAAIERLEEYGND